MAGGSVGEEDAQRLFHVCDTSNSLAAVNLTRTIIGRRDRTDRHTPVIEPSARLMRYAKERGKLAPTGAM